MFCRKLIGGGCAAQRRSETSETVSSDIKFFWFHSRREITSSLACSDLWPSKAIDPFIPFGVVLVLSPAHSRSTQPTKLVTIKGSGKKKVSHLSLEGQSQSSSFPLLLLIGAGKKETRARVQRKRSGQKGYRDIFFCDSGRNRHAC